MFRHDRSTSVSENSISSDSVGALVSKGETSTDLNWPLIEVGKRLYRKR